MSIVQFSASIITCFRPKHDRMFQVFGCLHVGRLDYQPQFGKWARAPPPKEGRPDTRDRRKSSLLLRKQCKKFGTEKNIRKVGWRKVNILPLFRTTPPTMTYPNFFFAVQLLLEFLHCSLINQMPATDYWVWEQMLKTVNCSAVHEMCIVLCVNNFTSQIFCLISLSQFVKDTKASTTSPLCSRKLLSAAALGISISSTWWSKQMPH